MVSTSNALTDVIGDTIYCNIIPITELQQGELG